VKSTKRAAAILVTLLIPAVGMVVVLTSAQAYTCSTVPIGQANPSAEPEPMQPIWCAGGLATEPTTRTLDSFGGWTDTFQTNVQMGHLNNGDMGYRVFNSLTSGGTTDPGQVQSLHFVNNNHWMVDMSHNNGGAAISPAQSFRFQNGKLVIEGDVAAGIPGYFDSGGDIVWPEIMWSTAPAPTGHVVDGLYLYGQFGGAWASGCRLNGERNMICSLESSATLSSTTNDTFPCFSVDPSRVFEISGFEQCGSTHYGGAVDFGAPKTAFRACLNNQMDMFCRDRFRLEWTQSGFTAYVNGILFFQDSGWPGYAQIPTSIVNGSTPIYAYFGEWGDFSDSNVYRFHWGRIAVNPHDSSGNLLGPSASPSYCPDMPNLTCSMMDPAQMCTAVSVDAAPQSPQTAGTQVTLTAAATGCPNARYAFWARWQGYTSWQLLQGYSSSNTFNWNSTGAAAGIEYFGVWAKDAGSPTTTFDINASTAFAVNPASCSSVSVSSAPPTAAHSGLTQVTFTAVASGCTHGSPLYEFWYFNGSGWFVVRGWSSSPNWVWNTSAPAGNYIFGVWVRDAASPGIHDGGSMGRFDTFAGFTYNLT
jgi:hypothetical protein